MKRLLLLLAIAIICAACNPVPQQLQGTQSSGQGGAAMPIRFNGPRSH